MNMTGQPTSSLSTTAKAALASWLAQSPPAPGDAFSDSTAVAQLARSKMQNEARRSTAA